MEKRVTQATVAAVAKVSQMTVSLALKNHPKISPKTRRHVQEVARQLKYRPDPMLSSLVAYRQAQRPAQYQGAIVWVTNFDTREGWRYSNHYVGYMNGAKKRAEQLGYGFEEFWLKQPNLTSRRAVDILSARNINGLIIAPQPSAHSILNLQWEHFAAVSIGYSLEQPLLHTVSNCHFRSMATVHKQLRKLEYRKIGLVMPQKHDERVGNSYLASYMLQNSLQPKEDQVPHLFIDECNESAFLVWYRQHRPDAIITFAYMPLITWLHKIGVECPRDVGIALPSIEEDSVEYAGIDELTEEVGGRAVEVLVGMLHRHETGVPKVPQMTLLEGIWRNGQTVRVMRGMRRKHSARRGLVSAASS